MKVEQSQVTKLVITDVERHDPIHVYLEDYGDNQNGRVTISEWGNHGLAFGVLWVAH
ncbi:hypothetical protein [Proteus mirabilis]|uniref:hypothetical protein n=1 Tax=Proteus mirabilis TaxID=584 RepID=UPI000D9F8028|nr:hypothetical protein [Proteus mirabilis]SPY41094.1 phage protein [Proteus mirabilis]